VHAARLKTRGGIGIPLRFVVDQEPVPVARLCRLNEPCKVAVVVSFELMPGALVTLLIDEDDLNASSSRRPKSKADSSGNNLGADGKRSTITWGFTLVRQYRIREFHFRHMSCILPAASRHVVASCMPQILKYGRSRYLSTDSFWRRNHPDGRRTN
jgi:hypothetical protein